MTIRLANHLGRQPRIDDLTIFANKTLIECVVVKLAAHGLFKQGQVGLQIIWVGHIGPVLAQQFVTAVAQYFAQAVIGFDPVAVRPTDRQPDQRLIKILAEGAFAAEQFGFLLLAPGDVLRHQHKELELASLVHR